MSLNAGASVGRYQIQGLLGSGGMGEVYKAVDPMLLHPIVSTVIVVLAAGLFAANDQRAFLPSLPVMAAMALRSLEDPELGRLSGFLVALVVLLAAAGAIGAGRRLIAKPGSLHPVA